MIPTRRLLAAALAACLVLAGCGGDVERKDGPAILHWYAAPDRADLEELAEQCTQESGGDYQIEIVELPESLDDRRAALLKRLLAHDDAADIVSVDTGLVAELGAAKVLAPVPPHLQQTFTKGVFPASRQASTYKGELVTVPWWHDPYLLWYRETVLPGSGLDPKKPIGWHTLMKAAKRLKAPIYIDDMSGAGTSAWVNALMAGGGIKLVDGTGRSPKIGLESQAGQRAATIVATYAKSKLGEGATPDALAEFAAQDAAFLLAPASAVIDPALAPVARDLGFTSFPVVNPKRPAVPLVGMTLGVPLFASQPSLSYDAIDCLTSDTLVKTLMTSSGHGATRTTIYKEDAIREGYPLGRVVSPSLEAGVIEPRTPYWHRVRAALDQTWRPVGSVDPDSTPRESAELIAELVRGGLG